MMTTPGRTRPPPLRPPRATRRVACRRCASARASSPACRLGAAAQNGDGFLLSRESIGGLEGWVVGKVPRAFYAYQTSDTLAPESGWSVQVSEARARRRWRSNGRGSWRSSGRGSWACGPRPADGDGWIA
eukprot:6177559-Pleurochrysis_carterae.AAC.4